MIAQKVPLFSIWNGRPLSHISQGEFLRLNTGEGHSVVGPLQQPQGRSIGLTEVVASSRHYSGVSTIKNQAEETDTDDHDNNSVRL